GVADEIADHPFNLLYELGFVCTVHTDNRLVSGTTMTQEFERLAEVFDLEYWQMLELTTNALDHAFCDAPLRAELEQTVIYPAYAKLGEELGLNTVAGAGAGHEHEHDHAGHDHEHIGASGQSISAGLQGLHSPNGAAGALGEDANLELSMENLKAELEQLGLSLDDEPGSDEDSADEGSAEKEKPRRPADRTPRTTCRRAVRNGAVAMQSSASGRIQNARSRFDLVL